MPHFLPRLALVAALILVHGVLHAQTTVTYTSGEDKTGAIVLDAAGNPTTLTVATGTATQSGNISESGGSFGFIKDGNGSLILTGTNTATGPTTIAAGVLQTGTTGALGSGAIFLAPTGALYLTGGTHSIASLTYNFNGISAAAGPAVVLSGGADLNSAGNILFDYEDVYADSVVVTGPGSRLTAPNLSGGANRIRLTDGGMLQLTSATTPSWGQLTIGGASGQAAAGAGILSLTANDTTVFSDVVFNHTATSASPYWFTSDGTGAGRGMSVFGNYEVQSGVTIFKNQGGNTGGNLTVSGGEISFLSPQGTGLVQANLNGGIATFAASPVRSDGLVVFNGGTLHLTESLTLASTIKILGTGGTFNIDTGKTLTLSVPDDFQNDGGQPFQQSGSYTKDGGGMLFLPRDYSYNNESLVSFTVRQGTLRTFDFAFDNVVIGQFAGDDGRFTSTSVNPTSPNRIGLPTSLGFLYASYWSPAHYDGDPLLVEHSVVGAGTGWAAPVVQSRSLTVGAQAGSVGTVTLDEGSVGGWYVHDGLAVIGGAGTGTVTLVNHFLYNNGHDIVLGQSSGGVGTVTVSGANAALNAGVDLVPLETFGVTSSEYPGPPLDHGVGNIIIGQGGIGHVTVTDSAKILAAHTFIGNGSDLTLGNDGTIYGAFTAQAGGTVHALNGARFTYTLAGISAASNFQPSSTFLVDHGATLVFDFTPGAGFAAGTYTLFDFATGATITGLDTAIFQTTGIAGYNSAFDLTSTQLNVNFTAVPEPSTWVLLALGLAVGAAGWRRRRARGCSA